MPHSDGIPSKIKGNGGKPHLDHHFCPFPNIWIPTQWEISLPVGQQDGEEQPHFAAAGHGRLHHLDVPEGSPVLSLAHEGLNYPHVLPWHSLDCSWMEEQGQRILDKLRAAGLPDTHTRATDTDKAFCSRAGHGLDKLRCLTNKVHDPGPSRNNSSVFAGKEKSATQNKVNVLKGMIQIFLS